MGNTPKGGYPWMADVWYLPAIQRGGKMLTERWRGNVDPLAGGIPTNFLLAWINIESDGKPQTVSPIGERGLFQIHPTDERPDLGLSMKQFIALTNDADAGIRVGIQLVNNYAAKAKALLAEVGTEWQGPDFWWLVKLYHGGGAVPRFLVTKFTRDTKRPPLNRFELEAYAWRVIKRNIPDTSDKLRKTVPNATNTTDQYVKAETLENKMIHELFSGGFDHTVALLRSFQLMI